MANEIEQTDGARIRLDALTLENRAAHLPEAMREPFIWLGSFARNECSHSMDLLMKRFAALKIHHDKTTWSKILRGMWQRNAKGEVTESPCLAEEKFLKAVGQLRNDARIKERGGQIPFVMGAIPTLIFNYLDVKRAPDRVNKFGVIIGETGTQKSASIKQYCSLNNHGTCSRVEAPERPSMSQFMTDLAGEYGFQGTSSYGKKKSYVLEAVNEKKTIIVENVQRLYDERYKDKQPIFSFLQKLQEDTDCTVIITFTPVFEKKFIAGASAAFFEQFEGRAGGRRAFLRLPEYPPEEDVRDIAKAFGMTGLNDKTTWLNEKEQEEKVTVLEYLVRIAHEPGRVRRLFEDLQDAKISAQAAKQPLTIDYVKEARGED